MTTPLPTLNPRTFECAVADCDGAGAIVLRRKTGGIKTVTFSTDGTNGVVAVDIDDQADEDYVALGSFNGATIGATLQPTQAAATLLFTAQDAAGAAINLATTACSLSLFLVPVGVMTGA